MAVLSIPDPAELAERIKACREELAALRKLQRLALLLKTARDAAKKRSITVREGAADA
jgi:hypothetical protein